MRAEPPWALSPVLDSGQTRLATALGSRVWFMRLVLLLAGFERIIAKVLRACSGLTRRSHSRTSGWSRSTDGEWRRTIHWQLSRQIASSAWLSQLPCLGPALRPVPLVPWSEADALRGAGRGAGQGTRPALSDQGALVEVEDVLHVADVSIVELRDAPYSSATA